MLFSLLFQNPLAFFLVAAALVVSLTIHEFSHAFVADKLGDPTARSLGRVTLDPRAHLDMLGTLMLVGLYTRVSSFILALHLFGIAFSIGFNSLGIRDFGLAFATLVVFLNGVDELCLDKRIGKK